MMRVFEHDVLPSTFTPSMASQLARPYIAASSPSSFRDMAPVLITFEDWNKGGIFDWYRTQPCTSIRKLEFRRERDRFKHEFVALYLENEWAYRVDRRPMGGPNTEVFLSKGCEAEDSITPLNKHMLRSVQSESDIEVTMQFTSGKKLDLYAVIAICVSIRKDRECVLYTLQLYNCYFVARTIVALVARHYLLHSKGLNGFRWDALTEHAITQHMFMGDSDWSALDITMKHALITVLQKVIWPIVKQDAELLIQKRKQWLDLEQKTNSIIQETVQTGIGNLVAAPVKRGFLRWILEATGETLWHENFGQNLSVTRCKEYYEASVKDVLIGVVKPMLATNLPSEMVTKLDGVLPKRLISRLSSSLLALLPAELWARMPVCVLEKAPAEAIERSPTDLLLKAPDEFLQKLPAQVFARSETPLVLTLPEDLNRVPERLLNISLCRMQDVLERSTTNHDNILALKLLKRLPDHILETIPAKFRTMVDEEIPELDPGEGADDEIGHHAPESDADHPSGCSLRRPLLKGYRLVVRIGLDVIVRLAPRSILAHLPGFVTEVIPKSMLKAVSADTLSRLPPGYFSRLRAPFLEKLPQELLEKLPETLLKNLPRETLERLPDGLLDRLPEQLLRNIPVELMENLPENISDLIREAITTKIFGGRTVAMEFVDNANIIVKEALRQSPDNLPPSVICISVASRSKMRHKLNGNIGAHRELQQHILDKTRKHSKRVAQVAQFGLREEAVYKALRQKTEDVWRVMRLHSNLPASISRTVINEQRKS